MSERWRVHALEDLRDALRRRDVYVTPSERYADARASLLGDAAWDASREDTQRSLSLPAHPGRFVEQLGGELDAAYQRTREGLTPEHPIHELAGGGLQVEQLDALPEPATRTTLRERVDGLATSLCAVLVAQACNVGYKPLVDESNPALREARLRYVAQRYLRPETVAAANARIVDVHAKLPLAERWGGGEVASIDGLRFVAPRRTVHAAYNRRYFDRRRGVTLLGTTADHYAGLHTVVITGTQPDAPYILDGLLDPQTSVRPREIVTDTAGYTDVIFGLFRLLGYQYSPRLADAGGATFWRINPTDYGPLNALARHQVNTRLVEQHYDDLVRVAGSLLQRHTTASQLVRALRSHTRHLASLARALQHVGRAAKTIHLLDYCNDQPFRRRILTQLNRGESRHALARDVCHGYRGELRQRYRQGQEEQLGALGLIVNAIVLYNTIYTQRALDHLAATGLLIDDVDVERLSPLGSDHLTLTGRYRIALAEALRDRSALPRAQRRARGRGVTRFSARALYRPQGVFVDVGLQPVARHRVVVAPDAVHRDPARDRLRPAQRSRGALAGIAVVFAIFVSACVAGYEAIDRLLNPHEPDYLMALALAGAVGYAGNWWAAIIRTRAGRRLNSPALVADGAHARADAYVSLAVVASAAAVAIGADIADPLIGLGITLVILKITLDSWRTVRAEPVSARA